ncbi:Sugar kinase of the NBD/HSP70 family, may contain an N-terminal HTH domain [Bryocella elongata]|uniref:Sugar kinase of the NBD/HSP70 family, may contain an N-terminal HTH domain n=1 Tax=Bryocella elongata TaxID=863522 RepID=A0A1H6CGX1_9BACT|nr:ROK family protein [Bryocella elongata]SEG72214.1 Sugar kinase of the NBD/HSP70 family, may contain an N-terminal HTH domain [Bryocella elongata]
MSSPPTNNSKQTRKSPVRHPIRAVRELAYVEVASTELTRDINRDLILEYVRSSQPVSRVDLARLSGLQPSTVSSIVEQLKEERWIKEGGAVTTARGRRPTMLALNDDLLILVADVRPTQAVLAVVDLNGRFLSRLVVPLATKVQRSIGAIADGMNVLRGQFPQKSFEGIGLSVQGRVEPQSNRLTLAPNLNWKNYDICGELSRRVGGLRVELENDANSCLLSELWFGHLDGLRNVVLIAISEGVGAAVLAEGRLISGRGGLAGEFGHICVDASGPLCGCGKHGCWEMFASSRAALRYYAELTGSTDKLTMSDLATLAVSKNPAALRALERQSEAIGRGLRMINAALSPEVILFAGDITTVWELSHSIIERECRAGLLTGSAPKLMSIGDGELALLRGAAAVVLQRHSGYYRSAHGKQQRD